MLNSLLANVADKTRTVPISEAALYALLGFTIVCAGIAFLILVVWLVGRVMVKANGTVEKKIDKPVKEVKAPVAESVAEANSSEELTDETVAVIMAAIMAYYQQTNPKCEFRVKRIKRI